MTRSNRIFDQQCESGFTLSLWPGLEEGDTRRKKKKKNVYGMEKSFVRSLTNRIFLPSIIENMPTLSSCSRFVKRLSIGIESENERHWRSFSWPIATNTDLTHFSPRYKPFSTLVHAVWEPVRAQRRNLERPPPERPFRFKSRQKEYGFPSMVVAA